MAKFLLTGFEPYGGFAENSSQKVAEDFPRKVGGNIIIETMVLPVSYKKAPIKAKRAIQVFKPDYICMLGYAPASRMIEIERRGLRPGWDTPIAHLDDVHFDNEGCSVLDYAMANEPYSLETTWPRAGGKQGDILQNYLWKNSYNSGDYVCNFVLYNILREIPHTRKQTSVGFFHIPEYTEEILRFIEDQFLATR